MKYYDEQIVKQVFEKAAPIYEKAISVLHNNPDYEFYEFTSDYKINRGICHLVLNEKQIFSEIEFKNIKEFFKVHCSDTFIYRTPDASDNLFKCLLTLTYRHEFMLTYLEDFTVSKVIGFNEDNLPF